MHPDLVELLGLLRFHKVEFLVVGSTALAIHAEPRYTEDLDLWLKRTEENTKRLVVALQEFGFEVEPEDFESFWTKDRQMITLGARPQAVDLLNFLGDNSFEEAFARRVETELGGVEINVIGLGDFIRSKRAAGRPKDLADIAIVEAIHGEQSL